MRHFNDFFAVFFMFFYLAIMILILVALINLELTALEGVGFGTVIGIMSSLVVLIVQFYFRKAPPENDKDEK